MDDQRFNIYRDDNTSLFGDITEGHLHVESDVDGDDDFPDSEKHCRLSRENTVKLFDVISLSDFIELCRDRGLAGVEAFFEENGIDPDAEIF